MFRFTQTIAIIGINPYVVPPEKVLALLFDKAGKKTSPIPVKILINGKTFKQHLVRYQGSWRLYLNGPMRTLAGRETGDSISLHIDFDPISRTTKMPPTLQKALKDNPDAHAVYKRIPPSLQKEIKRYILQLKTERSVQRNVQKAIGFLLGKERFIGRDFPH